MMARCWDAELFRPETGRTDELKEFEFASKLIRLIKLGWQQCRPQLGNLPDDEEDIARIRDLLPRCWDADPSRRPSFKEIQAILAGEERRVPTFKEIQESLSKKRADALVFADESRSDNKNT